MHCATSSSPLSTDSRSVCAGDHRRTFDKFSDEHFEHNMQLVKQLEEIAKKRGVTAAQLSIAWVGQQWEGILPLPGSVRLSFAGPS